MENQLVAQNIVPQKLGYVETAGAHSFTKALEIIESNDTEKSGIRFYGPFKLNEKEKNSLKLVPEAFSLNKAVQELDFRNVEVDHILVAEALRAGLRKEKVISIQFYDCERVSDQRLMGTMCEGLKERSTAFQLGIYNCSSEFGKPILEASYLKCFSLELWGMDCTGIGGTVKNMIYRGSLYYITLVRVKGLKEGFFLQLARSLVPNIARLDLSKTEVPTLELKRLIGSLKMIQEDQMYLNTLIWEVKYLTADFRLHVPNYLVLI